jgi:hypothetical protein
MPMMIADYGPGGLTGTYIILLSGLGLTLCLIFVVLAMLMKEWRFVRGGLIAAGVIFGIVTLLFCLAIGFGKRLHLL